MNQPKTRYYALLIAIFLSITSYGQINFNNYLESGVYIFQDTFKLKTTDMFSTYKSQFGLTSDDEMVFIDEKYIKVDEADTIDRGSVYSRYQQKYKDYIVENRTVSILSKCGVALMVHGDFAKNLNIDVATPMSESAALDSVFAHFDSTLGYTWNDTSIINSMIRTSEDTSGNLDSTVTTFPEGELVIAMKRGEDVEDIAANYALCWKFAITYKDTITHDSTLVDSTWVYNSRDSFISSKVVYVNANDGTIWKMYDPSHGGAMHTGNLWTYFNGHVSNINTFKASLSINRYRLDNRTHNYEMQLFNDPQKNFNRNLVISTSNNWYTFWEKQAANPYWGLQMAYEYFKWDRHGVFNKRVIAIANAGNNSQFGVPIGGRYYPPGAFKPGGNTTDHTILIAPGFDALSTANLEMMGHELSHALNYEHGRIGAGLQDAHEARAIDEGFADIFGLLSEERALGWTDWNWSDDGFWGPYIQRSFHDPQNDYYFAGGTSSATYYDSHWQDAMPYSMSGPLRKWFNHLSQGEWNWTPAYSGVGLGTAENIAFLTYYHIANNQTMYHSLARGTLDVAAWHYGGICSPVWKKVERAWYDVGVITQLTNCKRFGLRSAWVLAESTVGHSTKPAVFKIDKYVDANLTVQGYTWILPTTWEGTLSNSDAVYKLEDVNNDFSSKEIKVIVAYTEEGGGTTKYDTLTSIIHFSEECNDINAGAKSGTTNIAANNIVLSNAGAKVYPNPVNERMIIDNAVIGSDVKIYDLVGRVVHTSKINKSREEINTSNYQSGIYLVRLTSPDGIVTTIKLAKQ